MYKLEVTGILPAMLLAGLLGRHAADFATRQIGGEFTKLVIGMLIELGTGIIICQAWGRLMGIVS